MAPLNRAIKVTTKTSSPLIPPDLPAVYQGFLDEEWSVGGEKVSTRRPSGGYTCSILLNAALEYQKSKTSQPSGDLPNHPDPAFMTTLFFSPALVGKECEIRFKTLRSTKRWSWVEGAMVQFQSPANTKNPEPVTVLTSTMLFTTLSPITTLSPPSTTAQSSSTPTNPLPPIESNFIATPPTDPSQLTLLPICPIKVAPNDKSLKPATAGNPRVKFRHRSEVLELFENLSGDKYKDSAWSRGQEKDWLEDGLPSGADQSKKDWCKGGYWLEMKDREALVSTATIPFYADACEHGLEFLPGAPKEHMAIPTMVYNIDFKFPMSRLSTEQGTQDSWWLSHPRTVGLYTSSRVVHQGRHDTTIEVWTSPCSITTEDSGEDKRNVPSNWRERCFCLAIGTQMALTLSTDKSITTKGNKQEGAKGEAKL